MVHKKALNISSNLSVVFFSIFNIKLFLTLNIKLYFGLRDSVNHWWLLTVSPKNSENSVESQMKQ